MEIKQFYDDALAHGSYAIVSQGQVALIDPGRDPKRYLAFAQEQKAKIVAVFETHPHADFVSSHLEFHEKHGATVYVNGDFGASFPHAVMNHGDEVKLGQVTIRALFTPGHSPDHNSYLLLDKHDQSHSVYTGDSLFVGDVGRPDLREGVGNVRAKRELLAQQMYRTINDVFKKLEDQVVVYPAHGAGSLCGKNMSSETSSTIGEQKEHNWAFSVPDQSQFVEQLLENPPFIPQYFSYDVERNREGLPPLEDSLRTVASLEPNKPLRAKLPIVDGRAAALFKQGHHKGAINIQEGAKFETWLGTLVAPKQRFYLIVEDEAQRERVVRRVAKIGYEPYIEATQLASATLTERSPSLDLAHFMKHPEAYTIVDIRNESETAGQRLFENATSIPLPELANRLSEVATDKPVVVHCAGGYRSAAGASLLEAAQLPTEVFDLGEDVKRFL